MSEELKMRKKMRLKAISTLNKKYAQIVNDYLITEQFSLLKKKKLELLAKRVLDRETR